MVAPQVWCEKIGLAAMLDGITRRHWRVATVPFKGQTSYGQMWDLAATVEPGLRVAYLGDWNKEGFSIERSGISKALVYATMRSPEWKISSRGSTVSVAQLARMLLNRGLTIPLMEGVEVTRLALDEPQVEAIEAEGHIERIGKLVTVNKYKSEWRESMEIQALGRQTIIEQVDDWLAGIAAESGVDIEATEAEEEEQREAIRERLNGG